MRAHPAEPARVESSGASLGRMLIVDDERAQMIALCNTLRDQGYETAGFTAGAEALDALRSGAFELLLADLMMPEMDGIELLRNALEIDGQLVGIIMTGQGTIDSAVKAMQSGALDYILKPFKLSAILPVLARGLAMRRLRLKNAELERSLRQRSVELEAANQELEAFSYSVSHDLRSPLRGITGFSDLLSSRFADQLPEEGRQLLRQIDLSSKRMGQLIEDLLRLSQFSLQPLVKRRVKTAQLVREVADALLKFEGDREVELSIGDLGDCMADESLLKQVYVNLLSNALKFTRNRRALIEVRSQATEEELVYSVRDNGAGFDMEYKAKLFGVFQRLHSPREFEGTGVGLSIVQRIIRRHGGRIWAEGELDKGAVFCFALPANSMSVA